MNAVCQLHSRRDNYSNNNPHLYEMDEIMSGRRTDRRQFLQRKVISYAKLNSYVKIILEAQNRRKLI